MSLRRVGPGSAAAGWWPGPPGSRRAFTLVELLVVIAIIGLLAALVLPAIGAMREAGRRTTCVNNQRQIAVAAQLFAEANRFVPGWRHELAINALATGTTIFPAWPVVILPFLERGPLFTQVTGTTPSGYAGLTTVAAAAGRTVQVSAFICPSSPTVSGVFTPLVYAGNCGSASNLRRFDGVMLDTTIASGTMSGRVSLDDIAAKDGASNTLLIAEKSSTTLLGTDGIGAGNWNTTTTSGTSFTFASGTGSVPGFGLAGTSPPIMPLNLALLGSGTSDVGVVNAPSSNHPGGVVVAFCEGGVRFISDTITSSVYAQLLSWSHTEASSVYTGWSPQTPLSDSEY